MCAVVSRGKIYKGTIVNKLNSYVVNFFYMRLVVFVRENAPEGNKCLEGQVEGAFVHRPFLPPPKSIRRASEQLDLPPLTVSEILLKRLTFK